MIDSKVILEKEINVTGFTTEQCYTRFINYLRLKSQAKLHEDKNRVSTYFSKKDSHVNKQKLKNVYRMN